MRYSCAALIWLLFLSFTQFAYSENTSPLNHPDFKAPVRPVATYSYKIIKTYPHDTKSFTQGLVFDKGFIYEGSGGLGNSTLRKIKPDTGMVLLSYKLPDSLFGEGITVLGDKIFQLTWRSRIGFVYDKRDFKLLKTFHYNTEGWGLTHNGRSLIMSNGTSDLFFINPETFAVTGKIAVHDNDGPVSSLNELEYVRGDIYANVWRTDRIAMIDPSTGRVKGWIDLKGLSQLSGGDKDVKTLNGIAYDKENDKLFVTGKLWPKVYEIILLSLTP